jgi:hypothetical protein
MGWIFRYLITRYIGKKFGAVKGVQAGYSVIKQVPAVQLIIRKIKKVVGYILSIIGLPFVIWGISRYNEYGSVNWGWTIFILAFGLIFLLPGISFLISAYTGYRQNNRYQGR